MPITKLTPDLAVLHAEPEYYAGRVDVLEIVLLYFGRLFYLSARRKKLEAAPAVEAKIGIIGRLFLTASQDGGSCGDCDTLEKLFAGLYADEIESLWKHAQAEHDKDIQDLPI